MTAGSARDRAADPTVAEALADDGSPIRNMPRDDAIGWLREVATSRCGSQFDARAWAAARVLLSALAGVPAVVADVPPSLTDLKREWTAAVNDTARARKRLRHATDALRIRLDQLAGRPPAEGMRWMNAHRRGECAGCTARRVLRREAPHPGVEELLRRCDEVDGEARRGNHTPAGGLVPAIEIRALLGHTTTATLDSGAIVAPDNAQEG